MMFPTKHRELQFWHCAPMHFNVVPEAKLSSKTVVGNFLDYLVLIFGFLKRIHGAMEGTKLTRSFIRRFLQTISYKDQQPTDQQDEQPTELPMLRS